MAKALCWNCIEVFLIMLTIIVWTKTRLELGKEDVGRNFLYCMDNLPPCKIRAKKSCIKLANRQKGQSAKGRKVQSFNLTSNCCAFLSAIFQGCCKKVRYLGFLMDTLKKVIFFI